MRAAQLPRPVLIDSIRDGDAYAAPLSADFNQTNLFLRIAQIDDVFIKIPSERGLADYRLFVQRAVAGPEDVRGLEPAETFPQLRETLRNFPTLERLTAIGAEMAHYILVHKLQYERLRGQTPVRIPEARFCALQRKGWGFLRTWEPAMFQERMAGTTLWAMFDFEALEVLPQWKPFLPLISHKLSGLMGADLINHVDWNIQNFLFDPSTGGLSYVDLKPTTFVQRSANERNLEGLRRYYLL